MEVSVAISWTNSIVIAIYCAVFISVAIKTSDRTVSELFLPEPQKVRRPRAGAKIGDGPKAPDLRNEPADLTGTVRWDANGHFDEGGYGTIFKGTWKAIAVSHSL